MRTVIAHEYAHAVGFCRKSLGNVGRDGHCLEEEAWLDEAVAHVIEDELGDARTNLEHRVEAFLAEPSRYNLVVPDYQSWGLFRSDGHRGSTYLFLRWCREQQGPALVRELWSTDRTGVENLEAATGLAFEDLFRAWTIAMGRRCGSLPAGRGEKLGGPGLAVERLEPDAGPLTRSVAGTAARYFVIEPGSASGLVIRVEGEAAARLQVTLVPMRRHDWKRGIELGRNEERAGARSE
jgi:hypothetical protein